ncbi:hypothetical protein CEQ90_05475 [Lewinellaceae bacterium SD302]|nr:hypothetical protein CEQ90_05475 [Lewinellaceae bacterium SD302]
MKFIKRLLIFLVVLVVFVIGAAILAPILFKDQIVANVKQGINESVNAEVDFEDINVSFLSSFPAINLTIDEFSIIGVDTFAGYPLATGKQASVDLDFWSVISGSETGEYVIEEVNLVDPSIRILVLNETLANFNIAKESDEPVAVEEESSVGGMLFQLQQYSIENGYFLYDDRLLGTSIEAVGLNHRGTGDFTTTVFDLDTESDWQSFTLKQDGIAYLNKVKGELDAVMNIDLGNATYTFLENELLLNALALSFDGSIAIPGDDIDFDLTFNAPGTDFRQIWSLIPSAYTADYKDVKTTGKFALNGSVKGPFNAEIPKYPAFDVKMNIADGSVQYPGSPVAINGINATVDVNSPSSDLNRMTINLPQFKMNLGGDPFAGNFKLTSPIKDPTVDARLDGKIDLAKWAKLMPLEGVNELSGQIDADVTVKQVSQSTIEAEDYGAVIMDGDLSIQDLVYAADGLPRVVLNQARAEFTPQRVNVPSFNLKLGKSDLSGSASVNNLLAYFSPEKTMTGKVDVTSNYFDADEWVSEESSTETAVKRTPAEMNAASTSTATLKPEELFNRFDFDIKAEAKEIKYGAYRLTNNQLAGNIQANQLVVSNMATTMGETSLRGSGEVSNAWDYYFGDAILGGQMQLNSDYINLNDFMDNEAAAAPSSSNATATESSAVIAVPEDINLLVKLNAGRVIYTDMELENVVGDLVVRDKQVVVENGNMKLLGGAMDFAGAYDTSEPGDPGFRFHYDLKSLRFPKAFQFLNSFKQLAPIAEYIDGSFNSDLVISGKLGNDLYPKLNTINAEGFLQTLDASLASIKPLQKVGNALNVKELQDRLNLKNIKSWFHIVDGIVEIEPFKMKIAGIPMQINGRHGLNMDMDYSIVAAVPRDKIEGNIVTGSAIRALDQLAGEVSKLGLDVSPGDTLNFAIGLAGTFADPKTSLRLLGTKNGDGSSSIAGNLVDQAKDEVDKRLDDAKQQANDRLADEKARAEQAKKDLEAQVLAERQRITDSIRAAVEARRKGITNQVNDEAQKAIDKAKDAVGDELEGKTQEEIDKIKGKLDKFNPFKKPKKDGDGGN